jgi:hypothetical protein
MPTDFLFAEDIDARLSWPPGHTSRLARRNKLPHYILPDGSIRFRWEEIESLVRQIAAPPSNSTTQTDRN